jgi:hypothetical protein
MTPVFRRNCVILLTACFLAAQVTLFLECGPCSCVLHGPAEESHCACSHFCQIGFENNWEFAAAPVLTPGLPVVERVQAERCLLSPDEHYCASPFGRSPPSV